MARHGLSIPDEELAAFCRKWQITELGLFGSILRDDFGPGSDVDVLVRFADGAPWGLFALVEMEENLAQLLGRKVEIVDRRGVEQSCNRIRRRHIPQSEEPVRVAR